MMSTYSKDCDLIFCCACDDIYMAHQNAYEKCKNDHRLVLRRDIEMYFFEQSDSDENLICSIITDKKYLKTKREYLK